MQLLFVAAQPEDSVVTLLEQSGFHVTLCTNPALITYLIERDQPTVILAYKASPALLGVLHPLAERFPLFAVLAIVSVLDRVRLQQLGWRGVYLEPLRYTRLIYDLATAGCEYSPTFTRYGRFLVDSGSQVIRYGGKELSLTKKQFILLRYLLSRVNQVVSRIQIWENVWGLEDLPQSNCIDSLISRLRASLPPEAACCIEQIYGIGYRFRLTFQPEPAEQVTQELNPFLQPLTLVADAPGQVPVHQPQGTSPRRSE